MNYFTTACQVGIIAMTLSSPALGLAQDCQEIYMDADNADRTVESYICDGLQQLSSQHPQEALTSFEKASHHRKQNQHLDETDFLIEFCAAIAYDQLGSKRNSSCSQAFLLAFLDEDLPYCPTQEASVSREESLEAIAFLQNLIQLAPSSDTQAALQSIVAKIDKANAEDHLFAPDGVKHQGKTSKFVKRWKHILKKTQQIMSILNGFRIIIQEITK